MSQKSVLGKGLASLLPGAGIPARPAQLDRAAPPAQPATGAVAAGPAVPVADSGNRDRHPGISLALIEEIVANHYQPRHDFNDQSLEELAQSIRVNGVIQPLVVRKASKGYELIAGERRLRAAKLAGLRQVPVVIRRSTDREALELALIENIQREDLNCIDTALAYQQLAEEFSLTQEEVARRVGKDRASVSNHLRLLKLPDAIVSDLRKQVLSFGHGKALLGLEDSESRLKVRASILEGKLSVRDAEALVEQIKRGAVAADYSPGPLAQSAGAAASGPIQSRLNNLTQEMTRQYSTKVEIKGNEQKGKIVFNYASRAELDRLLDQLLIK